MIFEPQNFSDVCRSLGFVPVHYNRDLIVEWARHNAINADFDVEPLWASECMHFAREVSASLDQGASVDVIKRWLYAELDGYRATNSETYRAIVMASMT